MKNRLTEALLNACSEGSKLVGPIHLTPQDFDRLTDAQATAVHEKFPLAEVVKLCKHERPPAGDDPRFVANLSNGYRVVVTVEEHPGEPGVKSPQWFTHISLSKNGQLPPVKEGLAMFALVAWPMTNGFSLQTAVMWQDDDPPCINAVLPFREDRPSVSNN